MSSLAPAHVKAAETVRKVIIDLFSYIKDNDVDPVEFGKLVFNDEVRDLFSSNPDFIEPLLFDVVSKFLPPQLAGIVNPMLTSILQGPRPSPAPINPLKMFSS